MIVNLSDLSVILSVSSILIGGAVWVMFLVSRTSVRAANIENNVLMLKERVVKIESKTEYENQEKVIINVFIKATNSKEFKDSLKSSIREVIIHLDRNRSIAESQAFDEILKELKSLKNEKH